MILEWVGSCRCCASIARCILNVRSPSIESHCERIYSKPTRAYSRTAHPFIFIRRRRRCEDAKVKKIHRLRYDAFACALHLSNSFRCCCAGAPDKPTWMWLSVIDYYYYYSETLLRAFSPSTAAQSTCTRIFGHHLRCAVLCELF